MPRLSKDCVRGMWAEGSLASLLADLPQQEDHALVNFQSLPCTSLWIKAKETPVFSHICFTKHRAPKVTSWTGLGRRETPEVRSLSARHSLGPNFVLARGLYWLQKISSIMLSSFPDQLATSTTHPLGISPQIPDQWVFKQHECHYRYLQVERKSCLRWGQKINYQVKY